jgi:hypothetical protein
MSRQSTDRLVLYVPLKERTVLVYATYVVDVDANYGADADGNRGVRRVEYDLLDVEVDQDDAKTLTVVEVQEVLEAVPAAFAKRAKHF